MSFHTPFKKYSKIDKSKSHTSDEIWELCSNDWEKPGDIDNSAWYSDIGHIFLGKILENILGERLDQIHQKFAEKYLLPDLIYKPLSHGISENIIAKTELHLPAGVVQDEKARFLGGVAGHAGVFGNLSGLQYFATAWLENRFDLPQELYKRALFQPFTQTQDNYGSRYSIAWRLSEINDFPNFSGFPGPSLILDPNAHRAVVITTNFTFPARDSEIRIKYLSWKDEIYISLKR